MKRSHSSYLLLGLFLTCVFRDPIQLKQVVNLLWDIFASERSQWLKFEPRGDTWLPTPKELPCELCLFVESHSKWKGWDHFNVETARKNSTVLLCACPCCFQHCCANVSGQLEQRRATLCMWLFWQEGVVWKARKMKVRANTWGKRTRSEKCIWRLHRGCEEW